MQKSIIWAKAAKRNKPMKHKGNKWEGKTSQFKKRSRKRKDEDIIFDRVAMVEEESGYIIKDEKGNIVHPNNKMAHFFYPNYKCYLQKKDSEIHEMRIRVFYEDMGCPDFMQKNKKKKTFV